ncbi:MAG: PD-(D/E)XK nuclease family protein [Deltaproteobacteria bacterium]|nr:PD-(D/E)XK nuclease family protein [Deltaproteobacteria bacterium]
MPTVTQVLAPWADFGAIDPAVLARAARRGSAVHDACLAETTGIWVEPDDEAAPYLASFRLWLPNVEVIKAEFSLSDPALDLRGHPDLLVRFKGDASPAIIDLKTPAAYNPSWRPQLAAYKYLAVKSGMAVERIGALRLKKDGSPPIFTESTATYGRDLAGFMAALDAWRYFQALKERTI